MPITRLVRLLLVLVALGFMVWKYAPWPSRTVTFNDQNCQCQIPYNWAFKNNPSFTMEANRPYGGSFFISAKPNASAQLDIHTFSQDVKSGLIAGGHEIINESTEPFEGYPAYSYTMRKVINEKLIYTHSVNFFAGKFRYDLLITKKDADPTQDLQLQKALDSFSLINPVLN